MSKQLVARALELSDKEPVFIRAESFRNDPMGVTILGTRLDELIAALIRAVDAQYPAEYDRRKGFVAYRAGCPVCVDCWEYQQDGHDYTCHHWNTRVALLNLCRDILGEKE